MPPLPGGILPLFVLLMMCSNVLAFLSHSVIFPAPAATAETARGYLHGGLTIDFVGEKGPVAKWRLGVLDAVVATLQVVMVGILLERRRIQRGIEGTPTTGSTAAARHNDHEAVAEEQETQDIEAEERGVRRSEEIELQRLTVDDPRSAGGASDKDDEEEDEGSTATRLAAARKRELDELRSGRTLLADVDLAETFRRLKLMHHDLAPG